MQTLVPLFLIVACSTISAFQSIPSSSSRIISSRRKHQEPFNGSLGRRQRVSALSNLPQDLNRGDGDSNNNVLFHTDSLVNKADEHLGSSHDRISSFKTRIHDNDECTKTRTSNYEHEINSRRMLFASALMGSSAMVLGSAPTIAKADGLAWTASPVNKRSGITVFKAEETFNIGFITYLSRFLISFDEECQRWWYTRAGDIPRTSTLEQVDMLRLKQFGAFSASVEVGLLEYDGKDGPERLMLSLLERYCQDVDDIKKGREERGLPPFKVGEEDKLRREIKEARRQIVLLFGLLKTYQPVEQITKTLAAIDNAGIQSVTVKDHGGGYAPGYGVPAVTFPPPEAGDDFERATGRATLRPNGRILRMDVKKRGFGYKTAPTVKVSAPMAEAIGSPFASTATAKAFIFKDGINKGRIGRIQILSPGSGYTADEPIIIEVSPPDVPKSQGGEVAVLKPVLEYEVGEINIITPGNGYAAEKPVAVEVDAPPLTARINMNDPMVSEALSLTSSKPLQINNIFDPTSQSSKAWKEAQRSVGCVGRACYDDPVVAVAYSTTQKYSYSSFRKDPDVTVQNVEAAISTRSINSVKNKTISATSSGEEGSMPRLPFWSTGSASSTQLLKLLPTGIGLEFNDELQRYELSAGPDIFDFGPTVAAGKPIDPYFGPRGRSPIEKDKLLDADNLLRFALSGALCSSAVHLALTPLDVVKTNLQTNPIKYPGPISAFKTLLSEVGPKGFYAGWIPTFVGFFLYGGISYASTEFFRREFTDLLGATASSLEVPIVLAAGASSGFIGSFVLAPSEGIRIRSVAQPDFAPNALGVLTRMIEEEGFPSLFSAVPAFLLKEIPFGMAKFTVFDISTAWMYDQFPAAREDLRLSLLISLLGGTLGGITAAIVSNPADATISAMKKAKSDVGPIDTVNMLVEEGGYQALLRGLNVRVFFYTLIVSLQFLVYDTIRFSLGIGSDDLKLYLDVLGGALSEKGGPV